MLQNTIGTQLLAIDLFNIYSTMLKLMSSKYALQPGNYKLIYRQKDQKSTGYTQEKKFKIESTKKILLNL